MKKSLLLLFLAVFTLLGIAMTVQNTVVEAATGKVVYHYQKWYGDYDNVGLWVWGTGTGGSVDGVAVTGTDDFGVYFDVAIGSDATTMGSIPISDEFDNATNRWNHKDTYPGNDGPMNIEFDVTAAAAGAEMHVYFKQEHPEIVNEINDKKIISDDLNNRIMSAMRTFVDLFKKMKGV